MSVKCINTSCHSVPVCSLVEDSHEMMFHHHRVSCQDAGFLEGEGVIDIECDSDSTLISDDAVCRSK